MFNNLSKRLVIKNLQKKIDKLSPIVLRILENELERQNKVLEESRQMPRFSEQIKTKIEEIESDIEIWKTFIVLHERFRNDYEQRLKLMVDFLNYCSVTKNVYDCINIMGLGATDLDFDKIGEIVLIRNEIKRKFKSLLKNSDNFSEDIKQVSEEVVSKDPVFEKMLGGFVDNLNKNVLSESHNENKKQSDSRKPSDTEIGSMIGKSENKKNVKYKPLTKEEREKLREILYEETKTFY